MKVSVAVPTFEYYGRGVEFLDDMFRTISIQTLKDVEVVISDHSRDNSIEDYCNLNEYNLDIKYYRNEEGRGNPGVNTNAAIDHCTGEIIKLFYQDDFFYDTEALEKMYNAMTNSSEKWLVCGAIHTIDDGKSFFNPMHPRWDEKMMLYPGYNFIGGASVLSIKKEVKTRFDINTVMLLDVDFYYHCMLEYGMPILYGDLLIGNRARNPATLKESITDEEVEKEFQYCHKKYGIVR
jgi:glycosyltransferase involved in cell wall biosynthesis